MKNRELPRALLITTVCGLLSIFVPSQIVAEAADGLSDEGASDTEVNEVVLVNNGGILTEQVADKSAKAQQESETDKKPEKPILIIFGGYEIRLEKVAARTEFAQAGMQKARQIHHITIKLTTRALDESTTDFITPDIRVADSKGDIDVIYTHTYRSNTKTSRSYQYNLSRKPEDATVQIIFKNTDGETRSFSYKLPHSNKSLQRNIGAGPIKLR